MDADGSQMKRKARGLAGAGGVDGRKGVASMGADEWRRRVEDVESNVKGKMLPEVKRGGEEYQA